MEITSESSTITSTEVAEPQFDHHQSPDSIDDHLNTLSLHPNNGDKLEDREVEEEEYEGEKREDENWKGERERSKRSRFPVRPDAEDCSFYLRNGTCRFGMNCKFNHPSNRKVEGGKVKGKEETLDSAAADDVADKAGQINCKYFDRPGGCKYGKACKFNHGKQASSAPTVELNFMGLPIRLGEQECPYYMRNGSCKFGANCKFNHPDPTSIGGPDGLSGYTNGRSVLSPNASQSTLASWSPPAALSGNPSYAPLIFPPTQGVPSQQQWNAYAAPVYLPERMHLSSTYATNSHSFERNVYTHQREQMLVDEFPERPGQPECSYFLKTGNCKYKSACKFHHPKIATAKAPSCPLSDLGLPLRAGESVCSYYNRYGICKYGPACKYDHPVNHAQSAPLSVSTVDPTAALGNSVVSDQAIVAGS